jgi:hypothetical protein
VLLSYKLARSVTQYLNWPTACSEMCWKRPKLFQKSPNFEPLREERNLQLHKIMYLANIEYLTIKVSISIILMTIWFSIWFTKVVKLSPNPLTLFFISVFVVSSETVLEKRTPTFRDRLRFFSFREVKARYNVDIQIADRQNVDKMTENVDFIWLPVGVRCPRRG